MNGSGWPVLVDRPPTALLPGLPRVVASLKHGRATQEQRFLMPKQTKVTFFTLTRSLGRSCWTASWSRCYPPPDGIGLRTFSDHSRAPPRQRGAPGLARQDLLGGHPHRLRTLARRPNACRWPASAMHLGWHGRISWEVIRIACARSPGGQTPVVGNVPAAGPCGPTRTPLGRNGVFGVVWGAC